MSKIKKGFFIINGLDNGDAELLSFVESCHKEFFEDRIEGNADKYSLEVEVKVKLIKD